MKLNKSGNRRGVYFRTKENRENIRQARLGTHISEESKRKQSIAMKKTARNPGWRKRVSDGTKRAMRRPETKKLHSAAVSMARRNGVDFEKIIGKVLCPLGYVSQFFVRVQGMRRGYTIDFALVEKKIAIECDGPSHGTFKQRDKDKVKTKRLRKLGWKIIRVPYD